MSQTLPQQQKRKQQQETNCQREDWKQGQLKNNKYKDKKLLERQGENKDLYPKCKMYVEKGVKRGVCDRLIHFK